jgi:trehalose 6-phosphate phosphatase
MATLPPPPVGGAYFFDFDGTLVDIAPRPDLVEVDPLVVPALQALQRRSGAALAVISGRPVAQIDALLQPAVLPAAGQHGAERRRADGSWVRLAPLPLAPVLPALQALVQRHPALLLERKSAALALHYRNTPALAADCRAAMRAAQAAVPGSVLLEGKMVIELKSALADKGRALQEFMAEAPFAGRPPWFFGDDVTDEAGFAVVQRLGGVAIKVGVGDSAARWRLPDPAALRAWLQELTR